MSNIHPTAIIHQDAQLHESVKVGAYSIIGPNVSLDEGCVVGEHSVISGRTRIGPNNCFYRFCSIGGQPQDKKYDNEETELEIGSGNMFREFVTVNTGTVQDQGVTRIGNDNWIMSYVHIAHDCQIANHVILANSVQLAGHVHIGDWAIIGGSSAVHQFNHIGAHAMIGGMSGIRKDVPPFILGAGCPFKAAGINSIGLMRREFSKEQIALVKEAYKLIYLRNLHVHEAFDKIKQMQTGKDQDAIDILQIFIDFFNNTHEQRGLGRS